MKKRIIILCVIVFSSLYSFAIEFGNKDVSLGFGVGTGIFYPNDVNDWIEAQYQGRETYNLDLYTNAGIAFVGSVKLAENFRLNVTAETAFGAKAIDVQYGGTDWYNFGRFSVGAEAFLEVPIASGRNCILFGGGPMFHHMYFEDFDANTVGLRVIPFGMSFRFGPVKPQFLVGADLFSKAEDSSSTYSDFELNYNGFYAQFNILF